MERKAVLSEAAWEFETSFGVPAGHVLLRVCSPSGADTRPVLRRWEHEEYDRGGNLVAVYESWAQEGGDLAFVKYSPYGWVISVSGRSPRLPPLRTRVRLVEAA
jgi:hypothetical protein